MTTINHLTSDELYRAINTGDLSRMDFDTRAHLGKARQQADQRNYADYLMVDADAHHYESEAWPDIVKYIDDPVIRAREESFTASRRGLSITDSVADDQPMSDRLIRYAGRVHEDVDPSLPRDVTLIQREMQSIGLDYQVVFPTPLLLLGMHSNTRIESVFSWAYSRWLTEEILPADPGIKTMIYLPLNDVPQCLRVIEYFSEVPGVAGFMVASARHRPIHDNMYVPIFNMLQERGMPLAFHSIFQSRERLFEGMNKFVSVHALGFVIYNMVHLINMVMNGLPERYPKLKVIMIESGLAWLPFLMQRLDNGYMCRKSEAPLLKKRPSEYIAENFYYTSQPLETSNMDALEMSMKMINAETQLLFSSDYPHWDFNLPSTIFDLPFLSEQGRRNILGENARRVLQLGI